MDADQHTRIATAQGFIAALDQSGGSTPGALTRYGIPPEAYSGDVEMFDLMHAFRSRIITSSVFTGDKVLAAILFEQTMDRDIDGIPVPDFLWDAKGIVPFVKVDKGLAEPASGVRLMKPMPELDALLERAIARHVFGTKMRSVVQTGDRSGIEAVLDQQFEVGSRILATGLMPILEPEVDINAPDKPEAEALVTAGILGRLETLPAGARVMLKLTIPTEANLYADLIAHPSVLRVVALSGGYSREEANRRLAANHGLIASFSRALTEGLDVHMSDADFDAALAAAIGSIYEASTT
jgi:fructose-bisphosphate aldolase class I